MRDVIFATLVTQGVFILWGLMMATGVLLAGDRKGAKELVGGGFGMAVIIPIIVLVAWGMKSVR